MAKPLPFEAEISAMIARAADDVERELVIYEELAPEIAVWQETVRRVWPGLSPEENADQATRFALAAVRRELAPDALRSLADRVAQATRRARLRGDGARRAGWDGAPRNVPSPIAQPEGRRPGWERDDERRDAERRAGARLNRAMIGVGETAGVPPRRFHDRQGRLWLVREVRVPPVPWARGRTFLLFAAEHAIRRVWSFPADWSRLSDADLEELSWRV